MTEDRVGRQVTAKIADSAARLKDSAVQQIDSADRRTVLAADRTLLAAERTYAAWIRTGLAALASGVGARALLHDVVVPWLASTAASMLVAFSGFCFVMAVWRELTTAAPPLPDVRRIPPWLLIIVNGFLLLVALAALVGIWTAPG